jgi:putative flippase GtrA
MRPAIINLILLISFPIIVGCSVYLLRRNRKWTFKGSLSYGYAKLFYYFSTVAIGAGVFVALFGALSLLTGGDRHAMSIWVGILVALIAYVFRFIGKFWIESEQQRSN